MSEKLTADDLSRLARIVREPFYVYSPSTGGGKDYANLIRQQLIVVSDVGNDQETVLLASATEAGRRALEGREP